MYIDNIIKVLTLLQLDYQLGYTEYHIVLIIASNNNLEDTVVLFDKETKRFLKKL